MPTMDAEHLATHVRRLRLGRKDSDCAECERAFALTHDHRWTGFTMLQRCIDWTEVHPSDLRVNPVGKEISIEAINVAFTPL